ncbi:MAG: FAD-dependent oxidoreductase, partial [Pseudomonadota bacterium]
MQQQADVLVLGSGAAGLALALRLADEFSVALVSKGPLADGCTLWAQGGIAAVLDPEDSVEAHVKDTLGVGAGLGDPEVVRAVAAQGKECIEWLVERGVPFTPASGDKPGRFHLGREGGHSHRRIVHAADATG